ncbi:MAG: hypothetical protein M1817_001153 [Caeruleum heppii]|nr:MAG: hypothetical protein M1817_001153 [Caeruleum heppii]
MSRTRKINDYFRHKLKKDPETSAETNEIGDTIVVQTRCDSVQHAPASSASPGLRSSSSAVLDETKPTMVAVIPDRTGSSQSSQLKIDSSSQRTLSNGQVVIRSSDDEDDDSDGSFNALDELLSLRKPREVVAIDVDGRALRDATFLAGFIEELDNVDTLPGELVSWMLDEYDIPVGQLCSVINLLGGAASGLSEETRQHATCLLFRLCLDGRAMNDIRIGQSVQDSLISLTDCGPSESWDQILRLLRETIAGFTDDSALRLQMLQQIPISTSRLHYLRRCLAVRFFLEDEQQSGGISRFSLGRVMQRLQDSRFNINTAIDYGDLAAMMGILDIALDNGLDPSETLIPENEHDFNQQIDILAQQIKTKFTQIMDTGASHMKRTEAKEVLDRLHYRLVYAVRTKPKVKQDIFQSRLTTKEIEGEDPRPWAKLLSKDRADTAVKNIEELGS